MSEWFMGQELIQPELPVGSPRPHQTPPEGVIVTDIDPDGYTRRYLYKSMGDIDSEQILISEIRRQEPVAHAVLKEEPVMAGWEVPRHEPTPPLDLRTIQSPSGGASPEVPAGGDSPVVGDAPLPFNWEKKSRSSLDVQSLSAVMGAAVSPSVVPMMEPQEFGIAVLVEEKIPISPRSEKVNRKSAPFLENVSTVMGAVVPSPVIPVISEELKPVAVMAQLVYESPVLTSAPYPEDDSPVTCDIPIDLDRMIAGDAPRPFNWSKKQKAVTMGVNIPTGSVPVPSSEPIRRVLSARSEAPVQMSGSEIDMRSEIPIQMSGPEIQAQRMDERASQLNSVDIYEARSPLLGEVRLWATQDQMVDRVSSVVYPIQEGDGGPGVIQLSNPDNAFSVKVSSQMVGLSGGSNFLQNQVPIRGLGQVAPPTKNSPNQAPAGACPGAIAMPDGRVIEPEDTLTLSDMCEILPLIMDALQLKTQQQAAQGLGPMGRAVGGARGFAGGAGGGGGFIGGGGGGTGQRGATGPRGPTGLGGSVDSITKTDGDFTAGPGAFVAVPGTLISFTTDQAAPALFFLQAVLGATDGTGNSQSAQLGLRIDGTDYPLSTRLLHTFVGGVGEFLIGQTSSFTLTLADGSHTVEVILRGLAPGEFGGTALGTPATVAATASVPLHLSVSHS